MEDKGQSEYRAMQVVEVGSKNKRVQELREAWLNGTLVVDSTRVAQKIIDFERYIDQVHQGEKK